MIIIDINVAHNGANLANNINMNFVFLYSIKMYLILQIWLVSMIIIDINVAHKWYKSRKHEFFLSFFE